MSKASGAAKADLHCADARQIAYANPHAGVSEGKMASESKQEEAATSEEAATQEAAKEKLLFGEFLEGVGPSQAIKVSGLWSKQQRYTSSIEVGLETPELLLHCSGEACNGRRIYRYETGDKWFPSKGGLSTFITYLCSNCQRSRKTYSLHAVREVDGDGMAYKYGEIPAFGPQTPARLLRLFGSDRETFLKGRQCEIHGLGIGAFTYYRRVVESHKNQILDEVIRVSKKLGAPHDMIELLEAAKKEVQFSKALESVKSAIPQALLVNGHNPLTLLHRALSGGVHELADDQCLQLAHDVRIVLVELAERLGQALKDEAELNTAIGRLLSAKSRK